MPAFGSLPNLNVADSINAGLVAFWPNSLSAGTVLLDISSRKYNGTLTNFTTTSWVASNNGHAITFDGVNDYVDINSRPINNLPIGTFETRIRPNTGGGVVYYEDGGGFNNFALFCPVPGSGTFEVNIGSGTSRLSSTRTWVANSWYHIAITWGPEIKIYVDGALDTTIAASGGTANVSGDNDQMGRYSYSGGISGLYSPCSIAQTRIYRRALTPSEVFRLFADPWAGIAMTRPRPMKASAVAVQWSASSVWL